MVQQMNVASAEYPDGVDEFVKSGFTPFPAQLVKPALVQESPFQMECRLHQVVELGRGPGSGLMLIGEVLAFHAQEDCFQEGILHPEKLDLVGRNGGIFYTRASGDALFQVGKPVGRPIGYDALPEFLKRSQFLTGNDLGRLANCTEVLVHACSERRIDDPANMMELEVAIQAALKGEDLVEAWRLVNVCFMGTVPQS
jgi:hypothetical protein